MPFDIRNHNWKYWIYWIILQIIFLTLIFFSEVIRDHFQFQYQDGVLTFGIFGIHITLGTILQFLHLDHLENRHQNHLNRIHAESQNLLEDSALRDSVLRTIKTE